MQQALHSPHGTSASPSSVSATSVRRSQHENPPAGRSRRALILWSLIGMAIVDPGAPVNPG
ncbi:MAG: hypothetical protein WCP98_08575 [Actinomycetes bacterium]